MSEPASSGHVSWDVPAPAPVQPYRATASYVPYDGSMSYDAREQILVPSKGCCRSFFGSIFSAQCWFHVLYNMVFMFAFGLFASVWTITTFVTGTGIFILFPVGPFLFMLFAISWRWLGKLELMMQLFLLGRSRSARAYGFDAMCAGPVHQAFQPNFCTWNGFWTSFKLVVFEREVWTSLGYMIFVKFPAVVFNFVWTAFWTLLPLGLIGNVALVAWCDVCYQNDDHDWGRFERTKWIFNTYKGAGITVPVGLLLLCVGLTSIRAITLATARLTVHCLSSDVRADHSPLMDAPRASNY